MNSCLSTVGKKLWVALTGIGLSGFLLTHMSGNLLILAGPEAYNKYSHALISNPLIYIAEAGLVVIFLVHVYLAIALNWASRAAKAGGTSVSPSGEKEARFGSKYMVLTGLVTFVFLVLHLITFKYGAHYSATYNGLEMRDLHRLVLEKFHEPLYVGWYVAALLILGVHLVHGISALFQTLGIGSVRNCRIKMVGYGFTALVIVGFIVQPLYVFLFMQGGN
jgi:succinate dehydrogenase / fumarate reductase, cytochrome b subunit